MASLTIQRFALAAAIMRLRSPPWRRREGEVPGEPWRTVTDRHSFFRRHFSLLLLPSAFCDKTAETCHKGAGGNRKVPKCVRGGIALGGGGATKEPRYNAT